jgi:hypothetical protein
LRTLNQDLYRVLRNIYSNYRSRLMKGKCALGQFLLCFGD